jgi:hypothetical protein
MYGFRSEIKRSRRRLNQRQILGAGFLEKSEIQDISIVVIMGTFSSKFVKPKTRVVEEEKHIIISSGNTKKNIIYIFNLI